MTIQNTTVIAGPYTPNGGTTVFPFDFQVSQTSDVSAYLDGVLLDSALFSVTLNDDGTGSATFYAGPVGTQLYLAAEPAFGQPSTLRGQGPYFQTTIEKALDRLAVQNLWLRSRAALLSAFSFLLPTARVGKFPTWDGDGNPILSSGTGSDPALRGDLAGAVGSTLVRHTNPFEATGRSISAWIMDQAPIVNIATDHTPGTDDGTDQTAAIQNALDSNPRASKILLPPPTSVGATYKVNSTITLHMGQTLAGCSPLPLCMSSVLYGTPGVACIDFRAGAADTLIVNEAGDYGCGVEDLILRGNRDDCVGIGIVSSYSPRIRRVGFLGTWECGIYAHDSYVGAFEDIICNGASFKRRAIYIGLFNAHRIQRVHTSGYGTDPAIADAGITVNGAGIGLTIADCVLQGNTFPVDVASVAASVLIDNLYTENTLCTARTGIDGQHPRVTFRGGQFSGPYAAHPQYSKRGPVIYAPGGHLTFHKSQFETSSVADAQMIGIMDAGCVDLAVDTDRFYLSNLETEIVRTAAGSAPVYAPRFTYGTYGAQGSIRKPDGDYFTHILEKMDAAGARSVSTWTKAVVAAPDALFTTAMHVQTRP